jgi:hypothetical protein
MEFATKLPDLRFADFWHGYLRYLCADLHTSRLRPPSPQARSPGKVHTRADASIVRRPARGFPGSAYERETEITIARSALLPVDIPLRGAVGAQSSCQLAASARPPHPARQRAADPPRRR